MSSEFLKIDKFLLGKGFYKIKEEQENDTIWFHYWKENEKIKVEIDVSNKGRIGLRAYTRTLRSIDYHCVLDCTTELCHLEDLMELLGM